MIGLSETLVEDDFRTLMSSFPTGVTVVTAMAPDGVPHGLTCTALSSVSLDPPMLLVCLNTRSGTLSAIEGTRSFAVNLLHSGGQGAAEVFASPERDRFARVAWRPSVRVTAPLLVEDAFAIAECRVDRIVHAGDHRVIFGQVVHASHAFGVPLMYGRRQFGVWREVPA